MLKYGNTLFIEIEKHMCFEILILDVCMRFIYKNCGSTVLLDLFEVRQIENMFYLSKVLTS